MRNPYRVTRWLIHLVNAVREEPMTMIYDRAGRIGALVGLLATTALLGLLYFFAQLDVLSFIPLDIAEAIIRLTPGIIATEGIEALGAGAKLLIELSGLGLMLAVGAVTGACVARFRVYRPLSNALLVGVGAVLATVLVQTLGGHLPDVITIAATAPLLFGWAFLMLFILGRVLAAPTTADPPAEPARATLPRRTFLRRSSATLLTVAVGSAALGELTRRAAQAQLAQEIAQGGAVPGAVLPAPSQTASEPSAGVGVVADAAFHPGVGVRPEATPSDQLYIVASAVRAPRVRASAWQLAIDGLVDHPRTFSYAELLALPRVDQTSTLTCISNEVGGNLTGNITWSGVRLRDLLHAAGVQAGAVDVALQSVDGYIDSIPLDRALMADVLVAYGMNGTTLLMDHGFPARVIVPGIYGIKNVKWLSKISVVGTDVQGYWQQRGWSDTGIVKTLTTVDTGNSALGNRTQVPLENGSIVIGGYAFAGDRGIRAVEIQIDGGDWLAAQLKSTPSALTWQPWSYAWPATPGAHTVTVRATDGTGQAQTSTQAPPHPDGSSGWHMLQITVVDR